MTLLERLDEEIRRNAHRSDTLCRTLREAREIIAKLPKYGTPHDVDDLYRDPEQAAREAEDEHHDPGDEA